MTEPLLNVDQIQGNILAGFNKDFQTFLFLEILDVAGAKAWLANVAPEVATLAEVLAFNRLFKQMRARRGAETPGLSATWFNLAFSYDGVAKLTSSDEADSFLDGPFCGRLDGAATALGDPTTGPGAPSNWVVGGPQNRADLVVIVAGDSATDVAAYVERLAASTWVMPDGATGSPSMRLLYRQVAGTLPGALAGHEHFGFKDGISQPGVRGLVDEADFLTDRTIDPACQSDEKKPELAKPGQPLIWPGQFVIGADYPSQDNNDPRKAGAAVAVVPDWTQDGSYLVVRRLAQDTAGFWNWMRDRAKEMLDTGRFAGITPIRLAATLVGRWPSGTPISRSPVVDNPALAADDFAPNNFLFDGPGTSCPVNGSPDTFPPAVDDSAGRRCPMAAHIRKVNPRDMGTEQGGANDTLTRRFLRRGLPYGQASNTPVAQSLGMTFPVEGDSAERGLMFLSYQASIDTQFQFISTTWANSTNKPIDGGIDPVIGQPAAGGPPSTIRLIDDAGAPYDLPTPPDFVVPTGGGYFFAPSIKAITERLAKPD